MSEITKDWVENRPKDVVYFISNEILENRPQIPVGKKVMVAAAAVAAVVEDHSRIIHKNQSQDLNRKKFQIFKGIMLEYYIFVAVIEQIVG